MWFRFLSRLLCLIGIHDCKKSYARKLVTA